MSKAETEPERKAMIEQMNVQIAKGDKVSTVARKVARKTGKSPEAVVNTHYRYRDRYPT